MAAPPHRRLLKEKIRLRCQQTYVIHNINNACVITPTARMRRRMSCSAALKIRVEKKKKKTETKYIRTRSV